MLQLGKVNRLLLRRLIAEIAALTGTDGGLVMVDMDDTIREVHGYAKAAVLLKSVADPTRRTFAVLLNHAPRGRYRRTAA